METSIVEAVKWTSTKSETPSKIRGLAFSPSGRWGIEAKREVMSDGSNKICMVDMATCSSRYYSLYEMEFSTKIVDVYWISEVEMIFVEYLNVEHNTFYQIYAHVDHEARSVILFRDCGMRLSRGILPKRRVPKLRGANPIEYKGKSYYLMTIEDDFLFVPYNLFYGGQLDETFRLSMPKLQLGTRFETYELAFCYGSKIYMPVVEICNPENEQRTYRSSINCLVCVDMNKIEFNHGYAHVIDYDDAIGYVKLNKLTRIQLIQSTPLKYRQVGDYLLAYTQNASNSLEEETIHSIFTIDLRNLTIRRKDMNTGSEYFPTVYREQLMVVRSDRELCPNGNYKWKNSFTFNTSMKSQVPTLENLARTANVRCNTTGKDKVMVPFVFPRQHCCPPNAQICFCEGILNSKYAAKDEASENIESAMDVD